MPFLRDGLLAEETLNIFLLTGISNLNILFITKKINVVKSNIHDEFVSTNITRNLKKSLKKDFF